MKLRKKQNAIQNKQEEQHLRNLFYKKMQHTMAILGDASAYGLLDKQTLLKMYYTRIRPYKIILPGDRQFKYGSKMLIVLNKLLNDLMHKSIIEFGDSKIRYSLYDFGVYVETVHLVWRNVDANCPAIASRFKACFPMFNDDFKETRLQALTRINQILELIAWVYSDCTIETLRFTPEDTKSSSRAFNSFYNNYVLVKQKVETETLEIDGNKRTIYRICVSLNEQIIPLTITPEELGMKGILQTFPLKVFIQMHALERIETRLGKSFRIFHYTHIINAVTKTRAIPTDNINSFLFPVILGKARVGYLKANVIGDKLVIVTFLFLTNNGTPEGKKLNQMVGLQKADKKYLGIDKLSTFIQSDIKNDEKLKALFCEAGCGDLFNLDKNLLGGPGNKELATAQYIAKYLGI
jgi:hypothetical protein